MVKLVVMVLKFIVLPFQIVLGLWRWINLLNYKAEGLPMLVWALSVYCKDRANESIKCIASSYQQQDMRNLGQEPCTVTTPVYSISDSWNDG